MKALLVILVAGTMSFSVSAGVKTFSISEENLVKVADRFEINPFSNLDNYTFCFTGSVRNICQEVGYSVDHSIREYSDGGHGYFEVLDCNMISNSRADVEVRIVTDYGDDETKNYSINRCTIEQLVQ